MSKKKVSEAETFVQRDTKDPESMRLFQKERLILEACELIDAEALQYGVSTTEIALKLGVTTKWIRRVFKGEVDLKLSELSSIMWALDRAVTLGTISLDRSVGKGA